MHRARTALVALTLIALGLGLSSLTPGQDLPILGVGLMALVGQQKIPTSGRAVVGFARSTGGKSMWIVGAILALGIVVFVLPFLSRIPVVGRLFDAGRSMLPGQASRPVVTRYGTRIG